MPKHMISLKRTPREQKGDILSPESGDIFPIDVHIRDDEVSKLDMESAQVGDELTFVANVKVTSVSSNERSGGKKRRNVTLSVREASVGPLVKKDRKNSEVLYGDS